MSHDEGVLQCACIALLVASSACLPHDRPSSSNKIGIGITKDSRGLWSRNQASIDTLVCVVTSVHCLWFVVAFFGHQNGFDAIVILLVLIRVDVEGCSRCKMRQCTKAWGRQCCVVNRVADRFEDPSKCFANSD
jgi:hypothetical protein